jgi:hypothetical protein
MAMAARSRERSTSRRAPTRAPRSRHDSGDGGARWRGLLGSALVLVLGISMAMAAAGAIGRGPLSGLGWQERRMQPQAWRWMGDRGRATMIDVGFALSDRQFCDGDFSVQISETPEAVVVGTVVGRVPRVQVIQHDCSQQVPPGGQVYATVDLDSPLGSRPVIRQADQQPLPEVVALG